MEDKKYCNNCNCELTDNTYQDDYSNEICEDCYSDNYCVCENCDSIIHIDDSYYSDITDRVYCQSCHDDKFTECKQCGNEILRNDAYWSELAEDYYCQDCYHDIFTHCDDCGDEIYSEDAHYDDNGCYCDDCHKEESEINDYSYKPCPDYKLSKEIKTNSTLFFGLELEVENTRGKIDNNDMASQINDDTCYCKHDGSISDGFEIVTHPVTWNWYKDNIKYFDDMLDNLTENGFTSYEKGTCGIHIHMSKSAFTTLHLFKFLKIFYEDQNFQTLYKISQRTVKSTQSPCQWGKCSEKQTIKDQIIKAKEKYNMNRYTAVNLQNSKTVEIRIFRGTLNKASFHKNFEFLKSLYEYTLIESVSKISMAGFFAYVIANRKEYVNFYQFLLKKELIGGN